MTDFVHSDRGSIRCPYHNQREQFTAGTVIQPTDPALVRYPCGYVDGLADASPSVDPVLQSPDRDDAFVQELANRLRRLEERGVPRRTPSRSTLQSPGKKGGVAL